MNDSISFLLESDPDKLLKNPIVQEYIASQKKGVDSSKSATWNNIVSKLSKFEKLLPKNSKRK